MMATATVTATDDDNGGGVIGGPVFVFVFFSFIKGTGRGGFFAFVGLAL